MTKALLIARGGFIPDENRILRPTDRPGRPPFLCPVGADQSRDEVRAASWGRLRAAEQGYPARSTATRSGSAALKAPTPVPGLRPERVAPSGQLWSRWSGSSYVRWMADDFSARYGDLLTGSYDCVDRIVLNAYYPMGHAPGGFRVWWRQLHNGSDEQLDDNHLMRMAGRFARRVKAWGAANEVPVIYCKTGERKHRIAEEYLATHDTVRPGVFLVLVAKAPATVWQVHRSPAG